MKREKQEKPPPPEGKITPGNIRRHGKRTGTETPHGKEK